MAKKQKYLKRKRTFSGIQVLLFSLAFAVVGAFALWISLAAPAPGHGYNSTGGNPYTSGTGKQNPLAFTLSSIDLQVPVEQWTPGWLLSCPSTEPDCHNDQALWVGNKTGCVWDVDDHIEKTAPISYIAPGSTASDQVCENADCAGGQCNPSHMAAVRFHSSSANLQMSIKFEPGQTYTVPPPTYNSTYKVWDYSLCADGPVYSYGDPNLQIIPNSNGGKGIPTTMTFTVTNPGTSNAYNTSGLYSLAAGTRYSGSFTSPCAT